MEIVPFIKINAPHPLLRPHVLNMIRTDPEEKEPTFMVLVDGMQSGFSGQQGEVY